MKLPCSIHRHDPITDVRDNENRSMARLRRRRGLRTGLLTRRECGRQHEHKLDGVAGVHEARITSARTFNEQNSARNSPGAPARMPRFTCEPGRSASRLPPQMHQRSGLPWKASGDGQLAVANVEPFRGGEKLEMSRSLETRVLFRSRRLRRAHRLPDGICVAMRVVDAVVLQQNPLYARWNPGNCDLHIRRREQPRRRHGNSTA